MLTPTYRYHPSVVAQAFATLGCLAPGRIFLGLGAGEAMNEVAPTGADWPGAGERLERLREAVSLIRELWTDEQVHFEGTWYRTRGADDLRHAAAADSRSGSPPAGPRARASRAPRAV